MRFTRSATVTIALGIAVAFIAGSQSPAQPKATKEETAILQPLENFAKAFNARDAKGVAAAWSEKGEYLCEDTGERLEGRKAIEADFSDTFAKHKESRLEIDITKIRRVGGDAALVEGIARVLRPKEAISRAQFLAVLVRQGDTWLIDSVRESNLPAADSNAVYLEELAWLNGHWHYSDGDTEVQLECTEVANGNFRSHRFHVKTKGEVVHEGTQVIGWDAAKTQLRSWVFASDGSFGEGFIEHNGNRWINRVSGTLPDGNKSSATQIITRKSDNTFTWQVTDRHVGSQVLPNVPEVTLTKKTADGKKGG